MYLRGMDAETITFLLTLNENINTKYYILKKQKEGQTDAILSSRKIRC